jgi:putative membrane protein
MRVATIALLPLLFLACGNSPPRAPELTSATADRVQTDPVGQSDYATPANDAHGPASPPTPAPPQAQAALNDEQILQVLKDGDEVELDMAKLALSRSKDAGVRHLAQVVLRDHNDAKTKGWMLRHKTKLDFRPSSIDTAFAERARNILADLQTAPDASFDRAYAEAQQKLDREVLGVTIGHVLPSAQTADVKNFAQSWRTKIEARLEEENDLIAQKNKAP